MSIFLKHGVIILSVAILTIATIVVPNTLVQDKDDARMVWYGFPLEFVAQDFSDIAEKSFYPRYINFFENWRSIDLVNYSISRFLTSVLAFFVLFEMVIFLLERIKTLILYIREKYMKK